MMSGKMNTNQYCTREMAACNYQPGFVPREDRENTSIACSEAVSHPDACRKSPTNTPLGYSQVAADCHDR
jgi:hypothetical protein